MSQEQIQVPKGWKLVTLGSICEPSKYGYTSKSHTEKRGVPLIRITDINEDGTLRDGRVYVDIDDNKLQTYKLQKGDILIARTADVGLSFLYNEDETMIFASYLIRFRPNQKIVIPKFLLYVLKSGLFWRHISIKKTTTAVSNVNAGNLSKFEFCLPPIPIQKKIVQKLGDILGQLEEKKKAVFSIIDQNKEKIDFFEENWFSYLIDREIEHHPQRKEWEVIPLKDITNALGDGIHSTPNYVQNSEFYFINGNNLRNGSIVITQKTKMVAQTEYQKYKLDLNENTVLLSINGTIGNLSFYRNEKVILGKSACYINSNNKLNVEFLFYLLQSNLIKNYFRKELTKTSIPNLSLKSVRMAPIALPPLPIQKQIVQNIKNAEEKFKSQKVQFENIKENYENSITYVNHIQSSILDAAFSGKLVQ